MEKYFQHAHQKVLGVLGGYAALFFAFQAMRSSPRAPPTPANVDNVPIEQSPGSSKYGFEVPTLETFDVWASDDKKVAGWENWISKEGSLDQWAKQYEK